MYHDVSCIFSAATGNNWAMAEISEISADIHRASDLLRSRHPSLVAQGRPRPSNVDSTRFSTRFITCFTTCVKLICRLSDFKTLTLQVKKIG